MRQAHTIPRVDVGAPLSINQINPLIDAVNRINPHDRPARTQIALFELAADMVYPDLDGAAGAYFDRDPTPYARANEIFCQHFAAADKDGSNNPMRSYDGACTSREISVWHPQAFRDDNGYSVGTPTYRSGDRVLCWYNEQSGRWEILGRPNNVWPFELKTALTPGSYATAYLLESDGSPNTDIEIAVYDRLGIHRGRAPNGLGDGSKGYARFMADTEHWEIIQMQPAATMILCRVNDATGVEEDDANITVDTVTVMQPVGGLLMAEVTSVVNKFGWVANDDSFVIAVWDEDADAWYGLPALPLSSMSPMTSLQVDDVYLQDKTTEFWAIRKQTEGDWETWHTGTACS